MRSIPLAIVWEMQRRGRWWLPAGALGANFLPVVLLAALRSEGALVHDDPSQIVIHVSLVHISLMLFAVTAWVAAGHPSRLYAFPVPTSTLAAWHMLPAMAVVAIESLASTSLLNGVFDLNWPLWGPALYGAVALAWVLAAYWLMEKSLWAVVAETVVMVVLSLWFKSRYGATFGQPSQFWTRVTPTEFATMLALVAGAYVVAVAGMARTRRGDPPKSLGIIAWIDRAVDRAPSLGRAFRNSADAQCWFEWRKKGGIMPGCVVFFTILGFGAWLTFSRRADDLYGGFVAGGAMLSLLALVTGMIIGNAGPNDQSLEIGSFLATRPMTSAQMAQTILKNSAKSVLAAWTIWAVEFLVFYLILAAFGIDGRFELPLGMGWRYFPATLFGSWIVTATLASAALTGRSRLLLGLFCGSITTFVVAIVFSKYALTRQASVQFAHGAVYAAAAVMVMGTTWALVVAMRRALIHRLMLYAACGAWAALCAALIFERAINAAVPEHVVALVMGLGALSVAPLATAPLALVWNRNR
jgi:hypothetical protein